MKGTSERYREFWQGEVDSAFTYCALAELEEEPSLAELYRRLGESLRHGLRPLRLVARASDPRQRAG